MEVLRNGKFILRYESEDFAKGIKALPDQTRQQKGILNLRGMIWKDGSLTSLPKLSNIDTSVITDAFPYPQLFVCNKVTLVCGATKIYEWDGSSLTLKITVTGGDIWSVFDGYDYLLMSNGVVTVERDPVTKVYSLSSQPVFSAICNYNGQAMIGNPKE